MREIKFRGKRKKNGKWIEGYYMFDEEEHLIVRRIRGEIIWRVVLPETVGQYTGQPDKNGKEIWEGDIVNIKSTYETDTLVDCNATVLFRDGRFTTDYHDLQVCGFTKSGNWEGEVIGNRWDNPEMLKEKNDHI